MKKAPSFTSRRVGAVVTLFLALLYQYLSHGTFLPWQCAVFGWSCPVRIPFSGTVDSNYREVETIFQNNFKQGLDVGASVAVYVNNELVVDLHGGWQNIEERIPYTKDTLMIVYSNTKMLSAIVIAQLVQNGLLDYDERIATYWPEFAQGKKENVTLEDLLQHSAGVGYLDNPLKLEDALNPETFSDILARQPHNYNGQRKRAYHTVTRGWYENEVVKRVDPKKRTIGGIAKTFVPAYGIEWNLAPTEPGVEQRLAKIYEASPLRKFISFVKVLLKPYGENLYFLALLRKDSDAYRAVVTSMLDQCRMYEVVTKPKIRSIEAPSYSGYTNAHSIAKLAAMMANKGKAVVDGEPDLLDSKTYALATQQLPFSYDHTIHYTMPPLKGGFFIDNENVFHNVTFVGWTGAGGSVFYWNTDYKIGFGYVTNAMAAVNPPDERTLAMLEAVVRIAKHRAQLTHTS